MSCSILLKQRDAVKKRIKGPQPKKGNDEAYIDNVEDYKPLKDKRVVAIVPNMSNLFYCVDGDTKEQAMFRYTHDTHR